MYNIYLYIYIYLQATALPPSSMLLHGAVDGYFLACMTITLGSILEALGSPGVFPASFLVALAYIGVGKVAQISYFDNPLWAGASISRSRGKGGSGSSGLWQPVGPCVRYLWPIIRI